MLASSVRRVLHDLELLSPDWPDWAVDTFVSLGLFCTLLVTAQWLYERRSFSKHPNNSQAPEAGSRSSRSAAGPVVAKKFRRFQCMYLSVYLTVMLADWLQGTNMYTLYQSYGVDVGALFLTGFSSAAVFGTFLGLFVDRFGRRNGCIVFCLLEVVINVLEHIPNMRLLLLGRVLGGISTSLLFSAFESWMVSEHRKKGFPEEWLESTFSAATIGNGIMAVIAGVIAQVASDRLGDIGPFQVAIVLTLVALSLLFLWEENYGYQEGTQPSTPPGCDGRNEVPGAAVMGGKGVESNGSSKTNNGNGSDGKGDHDASRHGAAAEAAGMLGEGRAFGLRASVSAAWGCIVSDERVLLLGLVQSLFEGATYTFVFMWVPTLQGVVPGGVLPTGLVFSSFMVCIAIGGVLCSIMLRVMKVELASAIVFLVAAASMSLPITTQDFPAVLSAFLVLETCVGAFYSCSGLMRSRYLPGGLQSSVMNIFRLPLNVLVVVGTRVTEIAAPETTFLVIALWFFASALLQLKLSVRAAAAATPNSIGGAGGAPEGVNGVDKAAKSD